MRFSHDRSDLSLARLTTTDLPHFRAGCTMVNDELSQRPFCYCYYSRRAYFQEEKGNKRREKKSGSWHFREFRPPFGTRYVYIYIYISNVVTFKPSISGTNRDIDMKQSAFTKVVLLLSFRVDKLETCYSSFFGNILQPNVRDRIENSRKGLQER